MIFILHHKYEMTDSGYFIHSLGRPKYEMLLSHEVQLSNLGCGFISLALSLT